MNTSLAKIKGFYTHVIISRSEKWLQESFPHSHFFINYMILYIEHFCCHIPYVLLRENLSAPSSIRILALPQLGLRD